MRILKIAVFINYELRCFAAYAKYHHKSIMYSSKYLL